MQPQAPAARGLTALALLLGACSASSPSPPVAVVPLAPSSSAPLLPARPRVAEGRIREVSVGVYQLEDALFDTLIEEPTRVVPRVRIEPVSEEDLRGHRLGGVEPGSVLARLGLLDDDVIELVNGEPMTTERGRAAARGAARRTGQVTVVLRRNGFQKLMIYRHAPP